MENLLKSESENEVVFIQSLAHVKVRRLLNTIPDELLAFLNELDSEIESGELLSKEN